MPILSEIPNVRKHISGEVLQGSTDLAKAMVNSFLKNPKQVGTFGKLIKHKTKEELGFAIMELFSDEDLQRAFIRPESMRDPESLHTQATNVVRNVVTNIISIKMKEKKKHESEISEVKLMASKFLEFGIPVILEVQKMRWILVRKE